MGGGLMQLVAYGAQDIYLTGNPQITFFKVVYRRHTNFSMECIQQTINGSSTPTTGNATGTVTVSRNGDLLGRVYVRCDQDATEGLSGDNLINHVKLEIGGQEIDKHTKEWLQVWAELTTPESKAAGYKYLTGGFSNTLVSAGGTSQQSIMVPLQFYFCRNPGLALPLIALQYHEVKLKFSWGKTTEIARDGGTITSAPTCEVWADYIYLDTDERRRFAQVSHEYLIEQLQYVNEGSSSTKYTLNFNHPVKELIWTDADSITTQKAKLTLNGHDRFAHQTREYFQIRQPLDHHTAVPGYNIKETERPQLLGTPENASTVILTNEADTSMSDGGMAVVSNVLYLHADEAQTGWAVGDILHIKEIDLNADAAGGFDVYAQITVKTSTTQFTLNSCPNTTAGNWGSASCIARVQNPTSRCSQLARNVNVYSFALKPEEHQPSGTCNFSRIDSANLEFSASATVENIYAVNYNVLRVMSGMGGLAYSN